MLAIRVEAAAGVEIAHSLFSQMNTAGADRTAPRLQASCRIPWFAAPSPKKQSDDTVPPLEAKPVGGADGDRGGAGDDRIRTEHALVDRGDVHAAPAAAAVAVLAADDLGHHQFQVEALGDAVAVAPVGAGDEVFRAERRARADGDRLHPDVGMDRAADQVLLEKLHRAHLERPDLPHAQEQLLEHPQVLPRLRRRHQESTSMIARTAPTFSSSPSSASDRLDPAGHGRLQLVVRLLGLDLDERLALGDRIALALEPAKHCAVLHLRRQRRQLQLVRHARSTLSHRGSSVKCRCIQGTRPPAANISRRNAGTGLIGNALPST